MSAGSTAGRRPSAADGAFMLLALCACYLLKRYYSGASAADLTWILRPTSALVAWILHAPFVFERGVGYASRDLLFAIGPSCAGVNFLIVVFCSAVFAFIGTRPTLGSKALLFVGGALVAFVSTIAVNAIRIVVAAELHQGRVAFGSFTEGQVHRIEGVIVYFSFLCALFFAGRALLGRRDDAARAA